VTRSFFINIISSLFARTYFELNHRYLRKVDFSRHISFQKISFYKTRALVAGTSMAGRQKRQVGWVIDKPYIAANIFAAATNRTNKTDRLGLLSV
jgi:hypothetical protein